MLNLETVLLAVLDCATFDGFKSVKLFEFSLNFSFTEFSVFEGCVCFDLNEDKAQSMLSVDET